MSSPHFLKIIFSPSYFFALLRKLSFRDKIIATLLIITAIATLAWWSTILINHFTQEAPEKGGSYTEGILGQPGALNPLIPTANAGADLSRIIYDGLFNYSHTGELTPRLAQQHEVSDDLKRYTIFLRDDVTWHDGQLFSAEDVVFTAELIRNVAFAVPSRLQWKNVASVEKKDDHTVVFTLNEPSTTFLQNLTIGILPQHLWSDVSAEQFQLTDLNRRPVGTGAYIISDFLTDDAGNILSYTLDAFTDYYGGEPFIETLDIKFYQQYEDLVDAFNQKKVDGIGLDLPEFAEALTGENKKIHTATLPQYAAAFFNKTKSVPLSFIEVRTALALATDRETVINAVFDGNASIARGPLLESMTGFNGEHVQPRYNRDEANKILDDAGWVRGDDGIRAKNDTRLSFTMHTVGTLPQFVRTAEVLSQQWKEIGAEVRVQAHDFNQFDTNILKTREYEAVLYGHNLTASPDLFALWHSDAPSLNYAIFKNDNVDSALSDLRKQFGEQRRAQKYSLIQKTIIKNVPAIFLYSPSYLYIQGTHVHSIDTGDEPFILNQSYDRFHNIGQWYVKTKRVLKK